MSGLVCAVMLMAAALGTQPNDAELLTPGQALELGRTAPEVEALYALDSGRWSACLESKAERSCDSDWVTCVDDGWVVSFFFGPQCAVKHDGRLSVTLLINAQTRQVISRFPEKEYFSDPFFCRDDHDCLSADKDGSGKAVCRNFIYAQLSGTGSQGNCRCRDNACAVGP